ncbi:phosphotransferase [Hyphomicrobium sp.]|uniref:phosphotransferase enzyme family protein n=1 Tax=Hyphomicrobium sp. TaxID=82 RepID=UPI0025BB80E5|nr:phosphotransferase [Hyphomicrobium sp.]MCC7251796.1 phosphotransferase [Hyphomicrobium sp.]
MVEASTGTKVLDHLAARAVRRFPLPDGVAPTLINVSENATYRLDDPATGGRWALRIHREGYHSRTAIASELAWLAALRESAAANVPSPIRGRDGEFIQTVAADGLAQPRNTVLFAWEAGAEPAANDAAGFEQLGETTAKMHAHVRSWKRPPWFERHTWNFDTSLGATPHWGRWRDGMGLTPEIGTVLAETVATIERRLTRFGTGPDVFGLVHGDMRLANLLMDGGTVKVIDFDDCGFSWFLYDCATTVSFFEDAPEVPELIAAWVRGYRRFGNLSPEEETEIATFVMLRRILLVAWIGSHSDTDLARSMGVAYTEGTVPLCERYLVRFGEATRPAPAKSWAGRLLGKLTSARQGSPAESARHRQ